MTVARGARRCRSVLLAAAVLAFGAMPAGADAAEPDLAHALRALQAADGELQSIGWRLVTGNARFCRDAAPAVGLLLLDTAGYPDPAAVRAGLGLGGDIAVDAVAAGSPAAAAGLVPGDTVLALAGRAMAALPPARPGDWARLAGLHDAIDASLAATGTLPLTIADRAGGQREIVLTGVPACRSRFEVLTGGTAAKADGRRVLIGRRFVAGGRGDPLTEADYAAAIAHELAHNLLHHRARLDARGRSWPQVRATEREADRLSGWLLANAGWDPVIAPRFMAAWGRRNDGGLLRARTHEGWDERVERLEAELPRIAASIARRGAADWAQDFVPEP